MIDEFPPLMPDGTLYEPGRVSSKKKDLGILEKRTPTVQTEEFPPIMPDGTLYSPTSQIKKNVHLTRGLNPDQAAEDYKLGKRTGYPSDLVSRNRAEIRSRVDIEDISEKAAQFPGVAKYLEDRNNLSISRDDIDNLTDTEGFFKKYVVESIKGQVDIGALKSVSKFIPRAIYSMASSVNDVLAFGAGVVDSASRGVGTTTGLSYGGGFGKLRDRLQAESQWLEKELQDNPVIGLSKDIKGKRLIENPDLLLNPEWLITNVGDTAGSMVPAIGAALATGGGSVAASVVAGIVGGLQEGASLYRQMRSEGKTDDATALIASTAFSVVSSLLNEIGFKGILDKTALKGVKARIFSSIATGGVEAATEWAEEPAQALIKTLAEGGSMDEVGRNVLDAMTNIDVIPGAFIMGGGGAYVSSSNNSRAEDDTKNNTVDEFKLEPVGYTPEDLNGVMVSLKGIDPEGGVVSYEIPASKAVEEIDFDIDVYKKIRDCIG